MTLFSRVTEICRERLPSIRVARITIDSIFDLDSMLQPGIRFGVTVKNTGELVGTPIVSMGNFFFEVDVMDGAEEWIIQKMSNWQNGIYRSFYRIFYKEVCQTRLDGEDGVELGWRNSYDVFQLKSQIRIEWEKKVGVYNLTKNVLPSDDFYTLSWCSEERQYAPAYVPADVRKEGLIITFKSYSEWETWQFTGPLENFSAAGNWKRIDPFIATSIYTDVYDADAQIPLGVGEYYQISNNDDPYYLPSLIPVESRVPFMKVKFINSSGRSVIMRYLKADFGYFHNYDYWQVLQMGDIDNVYLQKMLTGQHDFLNLTEQVPPTEGYYMLFSGSPGQIAVDHVPDDYRYPGVVITFFSGVVWELWQFIGTDASEQWANPSYWLERGNYTLTKAAIEEELTGLITTHYHDTVQTDRVTPVEAVNAPIARSFSLDPHSAGQGYLIITDAYTFATTITIELTMSYLIQDSFYRYVLYIDMRHAGPLDLTITKNVANIILKGDSTLNIALAKGIYKIEFIRQMSDVSNLVLYARHDFIPDDI